MNSLKTQNMLWALLSIGTLLPVITFTSCETNTNTPKPKLQKSALPLKKLEKNEKAKKGNLQPKKTKNLNLKYVVIPDKSLEWANKRFPEIDDEKKTFPPYRKLTDEEKEVWWTKLFEHLEEILETSKKMKAEGLI